MKLKGYACWVGRWGDGSESEQDYTVTFNHVSPGKAKVRFLRYIDYPEVDYIDVRCRCLGEPVTDERFRHNAEYRGIPFAHTGMIVSVGGRWGIIVGHNNSANLDVLFEDGLQVLNCHPNWDIVYYGKDQEVVASFPGHGGRVTTPPALNALGPNGEE